MAVRSKYVPFTFQERIAPLMALQEQYDKLNDTITTLGEQANQYYQFLDADSRRVVDQYNTGLKQVGEQIAAEGMKAVNRNTLNSLRRAYSSEILPIQQAAQTAGTMYAQIREMQMKDPTLMIQSIPTVSELRQNPMARPSLVSGSQLQKEGATAALQLQGVDYDQIARYLAGDTSAIPSLNSTAQRIADNYGVSSEQAVGYILNGIMSGLGERATQIDVVRQKSDIEFDRQMRLARYNQGAQSARQNAQIAASREARDANMLLRGYVPDGKGGYVFDENAATNARLSTEATAKNSKSASTSGRSSTQYMNRTKGVVGYNKNGTLNGETSLPANVIPINDITKATTEEKVLALKHANIPIEDYKMAGKDGYTKTDIDNAVLNNLDILNAYRFYVSKDGKSFYGNDTSVTREVEYGYSPAGMGDYYAPSYGGADNEFVE